MSSLRKADPLEKFWHSVECTGDGCWLWIGTKDPAGYGRINYDGKSGLAHRRAYELLVGPIPEDRELDHTCNNRNCVNPAHLEPVTHQENQRRIKERGTAARGSRSPRAKLTETEVLSIVGDLDRGVPKPEILRRYPQLTFGAINGIANGTSWSHVTGRSPQGPKYKRLTPAKRESIIWLSRTGLRGREISRQLEIGESTVSGVLKEAGLSPRGATVTTSRASVTWTKPRSTAHQSAQMPVKEASR